MKNYMNEPVDHVFTDEDIIKEFQLYGDVKRVAAVFCIESKIVRQILKKKAVLL